MTIFPDLFSLINLNPLPDHNHHSQSIVKGMSVATKLAAVPYLTALIAACDAGPMRAHLAELVPELTKMVGLGSGVVFEVSSC